MTNSKIIIELQKNRNAFENLLKGLSKEEYLWKQAPDKWCLLEIVAHLYDEEREDFRARLNHVLENKSGPLPPADPVSWVHDRKYIQKSYSETLTDFLLERELSIKWLLSLSDPNWNNVHNHPKVGLITAKMFLVNWLAHDYLHIRQIVKLKFDYLASTTNERLDYAGTW